MYAFFRPAALITLCLLFMLTGSRQSFSRQPVTTGDYGGVGILSTRNARFFEDGTLNVSATFLSPYRRYAVSLQAMPWMEATFRYSDIRNRDFSIGGLESDATFQDRGADLKFKLLDESQWVPQVAVGLQDGLGTGLFSGEYLVASKRYYDLDFSVGIGWGLLGSAGSIKNPLTYLSDTFATRGNTGGLGGEANLGSLFSGETVGLFGGVQWHTPIRGLIVNLELDGNDYRNDPLNNDLQPDLPINFGITYQPFEWLELSGAFERGTTAMFRASLRSNLTEAGIPKFDPPAPKLKPRPKARSIEKTTAIEGRLADAAKGAGQASRRLDADAPRLPGDPAPAPPRKLTDGDRQAATGVSRAIAADVDQLFNSLEGLGLEVLSIDIGDNETSIAVAKAAGVASDQVLTDALTRVADYLPTVGGAITLVERDGEKVEKRVSVDRKALQQTAIVDHLFDGLEQQGFSVESVELSHDVVSLFVSASPDDGSEGEQRAAELVFRTLPVPVDKLEIVRLQAGVEESRVMLRRDSVRRAARIDQMFDGLEQMGFAVESIELSRRQATVFLSSASSSSDDGFETAARLVADLTPEPADRIVLVGLSAGIEATRVTLTRTSDGLASGQETATFEPDLTDNEKTEVAQKIFEGFENANYSIDAFYLTRYKATAFVTPTKFRQYARNVGRAARIMANNVPASVEEIEVVTIVGGLEVGRTAIMRSDLEAAVRGDGSPEEIWANAVVESGEAGLSPSGSIPENAIANPRRYPSMNWYIRPSLRQHVGGPEGLYLYQIWLAMSSTVELYRGLTVGGTLGKHLTGTLDEIELTSDSVLPHVRSDIKEYLQQGRDGNIVNLFMEYVFHPFDDWYMRATAGLLEPMFGGAGGEVLYRPFGSRLAIGADFFRVRQREYDQRFRFRNYQVNTGHLNVYYKMPWWNLLGSVHAGQFLAGDRGARFGIARTFDSGVTVGGWSTFTNVSAEQFGEGSFDKGFYISIPFELFLTTSTRRSGTFAFSPLTRDGGQIVGRSKRLYGLVEEGNLDNLADDWDTFLD